MGTRRNPPCRPWLANPSVHAKLLGGLGSLLTSEIARFDAGLDRAATQRFAQGAARGPDLCNTSGLAGKEPRHWVVRERLVISAVFLHDAPTRPARPASPSTPRTTPRKAKISSPHVAASNGAPDEAFGQMDKSSASGGRSGHGRWRLRGALNRKSVGTSLQESSGSRYCQRSSAGKAVPGAVRVKSAATS